MKSINEFTSVPESGIIAVEEGALTRVYFDIMPYQAVDDEEGGTAECASQYICENIDVNGRTYSAIVSAIVNDRYTADDVQAINANLIEAQDADSELSDEKRDEYMAEYAAFQAWRKKAKAVAATVVELIK